jgi:hypothetical protein
VQRLAAIGTQACSGEHAEPLLQSAMLAHPTLHPILSGAQAKFPGHWVGAEPAHLPSPLHELAVRRASAQTEPQGSPAAG